MASWRLGGLCWALKDQWDEEGQRKGAELWNSMYKGPGAMRKDEAQGRASGGGQMYPGGTKEPLCMCTCVLSHVRLFATPWTVAHQAPLSREFSRQEYWHRLPCPLPGDLPDPGIKPAVSCVSCMAGRLLNDEPPGKPLRSC